jgi:hypothetical protein
MVVRIRVSPPGIHFLSEQRLVLYIIRLYFIYLFTFCGAGDLTQGLVNTRQVVYY